MKLTLIISLVFLLIACSYGRLNEAKTGKQHKSLTNKQKLNTEL